MGCSAKPGGTCNPAPATTSVIQSTYASTSSSVTSRTGSSRRRIAVTEPSSRETDRTAKRSVSTTARRPAATEYRGPLPKGYSMTWAVAPSTEALTSGPGTSMTTRTLPSTSDRVAIRTVGHRTIPSSGSPPPALKVSTGRRPDTPMTPVGGAPRPGCLHAKRAHRATFGIEELDPVQPDIPGHHGIARNEAHEHQHSDAPRDPPRAPAARHTRVPSGS